jgi:hypothetical protein
MTGPPQQWASSSSALASSPRQFIALERLVYGSDLEMPIDGNWPMLLKNS